jgi:hypothetical protein
MFQMTCATDPLFDPLPITMRKAEDAPKVGVRRLFHEAPQSSPCLADQLRDGTALSYSGLGETSVAILAMPLA